MLSTARAMPTQSRDLEQTGHVECVSSGSADVFSADDSVPIPGMGGCLSD